MLFSDSKSLRSLKYRPEIDGLRGVAVLLVVAFHAFPSTIKGGFIGVDIFFVISGFLISTIIFNHMHNSTFSFNEFYIRRVLRIFPALLCILILSYVFGWFALLTDEYKQLGKHISSGAGFGANFLLLSESGYFDSIAETKPLLHLWSLGIEEQFYLLWPLVLWLCWKIKLNIFAIICLITLISFALNIQTIHSDATATFYLPQTRFWELLTGSVLAWCMLDEKHKTWESIVLSLIKNRIMHNSKFYNITKKIKFDDFLSVLGLVILAIGSAVITKERLFPGWWALIPIFGAVLIIYSGEKSMINQRVFANPLIVWFGLISFPLYLCHWPILSFARIIESEIPSIGIRIAGISASVLSAWIIYAWIESPMRSGGNKGKKAVFLIFTMLLVGAVGYLTYARDGFPELRPHIKLYSNNKNELIRLPLLDNECLNYIKNTNPLFPYCRFENVGSKETVAVIGDSHAHVAFPGIANILSKQNVNTVLLANSGCPPFIGAEYGDNEQEKSSCGKRIEQLTQTVLAKKDIHKVFIFSRGPIYLTGKYFGEASVGDVKGPMIISSVFQNALQKTINILYHSGKSVYYVTENPELPFLPAACVLRPFRFSQTKCGVDLATVKQRQKQYLELLQHLQHVTIINSTPTFCPNDSCEPFFKGKLLYADYDHLSVSGSKFQATRVLKNYL